MGYHSRHVWPADNGPVRHPKVVNRKGSDGDHLTGSFLRRRGYSRWQRPKLAVVKEQARSRSSAETECLDPSVVYSISFLPWLKPAGLLRGYR